MPTRCLPYLLLTVAAHASLRPAAESTQPVRIGADDKSIQYIGRFDSSETKARAFAWSGSRIIARFSGSGIAAEFTGTSQQYLQVILDGGAPTVLQLENGRHTYELAKQLPPGSHTVDIFRRVEAEYGITKFHGFLLAEGGILLAPPARTDRRIEFIGDSITCGYGNEGVNKEGEPFHCDTENHYLTYAAIAARALGAEHVAVAWSGGWLSDRTTSNKILPRLYGQILPTDAVDRWDFNQWIPQAVVVNLGTNDWVARAPTDKDWVRQYHDFLAVVRSHYPGAHIFLAVGSMLCDEGLVTVRSAVQTVIAEEQAAGHPKPTLVEFEPQNQADGIGNCWHPSVKTHQKMAAVLVTAIKSEMGW